MRNLICIGVFLFLSCNKFLDEKPDIAWQEPQTLEDLQALLNNESSINGYQPSIGDIASDYYYLNGQNYASRNANVRQMYIWDEQALTDNTWTFSMGQIFNINLVLANIDKVSVGKMSEADRVRIEGNARFLRAYIYFQLATIFAPNYNEVDKDVLTIPIKKSPDINEGIKLATLEELYSFIEADMKKAIELLPENSAFQTRPTRLAAQLLLCRYYMSIGTWEDAALTLGDIERGKDLLIDFNGLQKGTAIPFQRFNKETIYYTTISGNESVFAPSICNVPIELFNLYDDLDLRKQLLFTGTGDNIRFKGSYTGSNTATIFGGITAGEMLLNYAEIMIRTDQIEKGISALNLLLQKRYVMGSFVDYPVLSKQDALEIVKKERLKELCFKGGIRWMDLKRYASENDGPYLLSRTIDGKHYTLDLKANPTPFKLPAIVGKGGAK